MLFLFCIKNVRRCQLPLSRLLLIWSYLRVSSLRRHFKNHKLHVLLAFWKVLFIQLRTVLSFQEIALDVCSRHYLLHYLIKKAWVVSHLLNICRDNLAFDSRLPLRVLETQFSYLNFSNRKKIFSLLSL